MTFHWKIVYTAKYVISCCSCSRNSVVCKYSTVVDNLHNVEPFNYSLSITYKTSYTAVYHFLCSWILITIFSSEADVITSVSHSITMDKKTSFIHFKMIWVVIGVVFGGIAYDDTTIHDRTTVSMSSSRWLLSHR